MLTNPTLALEKNLSAKNFVILFELTFDDSDPANPVNLRFTRYNVPIVFEGVTWEPFPFGAIELTQSTTGEVPAFDIALSNAGRLMIGIMEQYELDNKNGRLIWVHPDHLNDPTAKVEEPFTVVGARANESTGILTVAPVGFDPLTVQLPRKVVSLDDFPGVVGNRGAYLV
jgi:hypothetical protein